MEQLDLPLWWWEFFSVLFILIFREIAASQQSRGGTGCILKEERLHCRNGGVHPAICLICITMYRYLHTIPPECNYYGYL